MTSSDWNPKRIFTLWEPRGSLPAYLALCRETWDKILSDYAIVDLDYSNLEEFAGKGTLDLGVLKRFPLKVQKDGIESAVLNRHGGVFMDMDTLILDDISPILDTLRRTEVVMFAQHLAFVAARPRAMLTNLWLAGVMKRLAQITSGEYEATDALWDGLGNNIVAEVHRMMIDRSIVLRMIRRSPIGRRFWPSMSRQTGQSGTSQANQTLKPRGKSFLRDAARKLIFATHRRELIMLDRAKHGFIAESRYFEGAAISDVERYRRFWLEDVIDTNEVIRPGVRVVALHHGWTPDWYKELSREEVLAHPCLLSRVLKQLLES